MSTILSLGLPGVVGLLGIVALLLYRLQAPQETRTSVAVLFIFIAWLGSLFINGFAITHTTKSILGQLDTVIAYVFLGFSLLEVILSHSAVKWTKNEIMVLLGLVGFSTINIGWKFFIEGGLISSDFIFVVTVIFLIFLRPTAKDLSLLPLAAACLLVVLFISAVMGYQNPYFPYTQLDYGVDGPYHNFMWDVFGLSERFRGPYQHPNALGIQVTLLGTIILLKNSKLYLYVLPLCFTLLSLASSRTSLIALSLGLLVRIYFEVAEKELFTSQKEDLQSPETIRKSGKKLKNLAFGTILLSLSLFLLQKMVGDNTSFTGRTNNYALIIAELKGHYLLGLGPSLQSLNRVENTILTVLSYYGLLGLCFLLSCVVGLSQSYTKNKRYLQSQSICLAAVFLTASLGESLFGGSSNDIGPLYFIIALVLSRRNYVIA